MKYKRPESVLVVLYDQHHRVLVLQRKDDPEFWQSVTGALEEGEQPVDTAYREVAEETGLTLSPTSGQIRDCQITNQYPIRSRWRHRYPPDTRFNTEYVFIAQVDSRQAIQLTEHLAFEWLAKSDALAKLWSPSNRDAVERFVPGGN
ncbi:dihydroneopterin triphosphate diphosphatase [Alteromonas aestuariivivens]|uniref:Dihydroneopterin triphosphate diphosphatase n=1 Tax=Alteromonas aestuariivivens TaxID=1938339 RepID=A0A3D8M6Q3_9ALTE|nr:dihydroneopterin triphosphate diphosphatase [Alteromonas aestuariivivens]RDV25234.1 dihydroneopterin triphosphate diphosphatase [Alteromonas aestuariivivens]